MLLVVLDIIGAQCFLCFSHVYGKNVPVYREILILISSLVNDHLQSLYVGQECLDKK